MGRVKRIVIILVAALLVAGAVRVMAASFDHSVVPVPGDYDGDGRTDAAIFTPGDGVWHIVYSSGGTLTVQWGNGFDDVAQGDYDGDGRTDIAVFRTLQRTLFIRYATGATTGIVIEF